MPEAFVLLPDPLSREHKRLLVSYSEERAALDASNREKGVRKLKAKYATGTVTKSKITQRGYNRFLK